MKKFFLYVFLTALGLIMIYPLIWLFFSSFKPNHEIFGSISLLPKTWMMDSYMEGWKGSGQFTYGTFFTNTFMLVVPTVFFTIVSSVLVGYGFSRFDFPLKKIFFILMLSTLMLPNTVIIIPRYILFGKLGWINTYLPFIVPAVFGCYPFFIYMVIQFMRGLPKDLDEAAKIDGCGPFKTLVKIIVPLLSPAIISAVIFQFLWTWNDFFNSMIYISSVKKYPVSLALRMGLDSASKINWSTILAMSMVSMVPCILLFFMCQKYFVEGISTSGIKA